MNSICVIERGEGKENQNVKKGNELNCNKPKRIQITFTLHQYLLQKRYIQNLLTKKGNLNFPNQQIEEDPLAFCHSILQNK